MQGHCIVWLPTSHFTQTISCDRRHCSANCYIFFFVFLMCWLILCYTPYKKKVLKVVSSSFQTCITHKNTLIACQSTIVKLYTLYSELFLSECIQCKDYYSTVHPIRCFTSKNKLRLFMYGRQGVSHLLFILSP